jgi:hypothetical protein
MQPNQNVGGDTAERAAAVATASCFLNFAYGGQTNRTETGEK